MTDAGRAGKGRDTGEVQFTTMYHLGENARIGFDHADLRGRRRDQELVEHRRQQSARETRHQPDPDHAIEALIGDALAGRFQPLQHRDALLIIEFAGAGRRDHAAATLEQGRTEFALELADMMGHAGLGRALAYRRRGE